MKSAWVQVIVFLCGGFVATGWCDSVYRTKALAPAHRRELERDIASCMAEVRAARDAEQRSRYQEQLCKKLIQAEEYDLALRVAQEVVDNERADPERRAVHHFLIAQIYAMRMEASPTLELMEENRRLAIQAAQEVLARRYPRSWLVGESAAQLIRSLNDAKHLREVRGWVEKRQNDPTFQRKFDAAKIRTVETGLERGMSQSAWSSGQEIFDRGVTPLPRGTASVSYSRAGTDGAPAPNAATGASEIQKRTRIFRGPIIVDGSKVHALREIHSPSVAERSPYAPGAAPRTGRAGVGGNDPIPSSPATR